MTQTEALKLALEALEMSDICADDCKCTRKRAITAVKAALEAKDEPDAYGYAKRLAEAIWSKHYKTIAPQWEPFDELIGVLTQIDNMTVGLISTPQQEANDEIDWKDMYEKQKRHSEMWVAKYEKDIGPLEKAVPQKEAKDKIVAWVYPEFWQHLENLNCGTAYRLTGIGRQPLYTTPPPVAEPHKRTWQSLTDEEIQDALEAEFLGSDLKRNWQDDLRVARAIEAAHGIKGEV